MIRHARNPLVVDMHAGPVGAPRTHAGSVRLRSAAPAEVINREHRAILDAIASADPETARSSWARRRLLGQVE